MAKATRQERLQRGQLIARMDAIELLRAEEFFDKVGAAAVQAAFRRLRTAQAQGEYIRTEEGFVRWAALGYAEKFGRDEERARRKTRKEKEGT